MQDLVYENIIAFARRRPHLFQPYLTDFFIKTASDSAGIRTQKLEMLVLLASEGNIAKLLIEFTQYVRHPDKKFVVEVIDAVGRISSAIPKVSKRCLEGLLGLISHPASPDTVISASVIVMRRILQQRKEVDMEAEEKEQREKEEAEKAAAEAEAEAEAKAKAKTEEGASGDANSAADGADADAASPADDGGEAAATAAYKAAKKFFKANPDDQDAKKAFKSAKKALKISQKSAEKLRRQKERKQRP